MFQRILLAVDGSESSLHAAEAAVELAALVQAELHLLSVEETLPRYVATHEESSAEHAAALSYYGNIQAPLRKLAEQRGVRVTTAITSGHEGQMIVSYIQEQRCDLLLLGYQGYSSVWGAFLGGTADKVVSQAPCSVLVIRTKPGKALFKNLLVALDGSLLSWRAFQAGLELAKLFGATLHTASIIESSTTPPKYTSSRTGPLPSAESQWDWDAYLQRTQALVTAQAQIAGLALETIRREGHASGVLTAIARERHCDLLILGATGHEHPWSATTGGTARKVANEAPCAVLLVRPLAVAVSVHDVMALEVTTVTPHTPLEDVIRLLMTQGVKMLVVVGEEGEVQGVMTLGHLLTRANAFRQLDPHAITDRDDLGQRLRQIFTVEQSAGEVMIRQPLVVQDDTALEVAAQVMISRRVTRAPVVDAQEKLVGLLSQAALLHYYSGLPGSSEARPPREDASPEKHARTVGEAILSQVPLVVAATPLLEVLRQVEASPLRRVIVVEHEGRALGVIGDRDLLAAHGITTHHHPLLALAGRFSLHLPEDLFRRWSSQGALTAQQIMRPHLFAVTPTAPTGEAIRTMLAHQIKRLVVVDEAGKPLGLVDRQQLLRSLIVEGATIDEMRIGEQEPRAAAEDETEE
jgi:nucleotide-binding universal stress UspA family protein/CBS domain-containing protein